MKIEIATIITAFVLSTGIGFGASALVRAELHEHAVLPGHTDNRVVLGRIDERLQVLERRLDHVVDLLESAAR